MIYFFENVDTNKQTSNINQQPEQIATTMPSSSISYPPAATTTNVSS